LIISEINKALSSVENFTKLNEMTFVMSLNELKKKLSIVYHDFLNVFDREKTTHLSLHQSYDHKIELEDESQLSRSQLYLLLNYKLQKIKEYLEENLKKKFVGKCGGRLVPNRSIGLVSWVKPRGAALAYVTVYS
jgi:hypothetical protein